MAAFKVARSDDDAPGKPQYFMVKKWKKLKKQENWEGIMGAVEGAAADALKHLDGEELDAMAAPGGKHQEADAAPMPGGEE